jgi:hypothetical protein
MAEQTPEAWIGQDVTIFFGPKGSRNIGVLREVGDKGLMIEVPSDNEKPFELWYPYGSIARMGKGRPRDIRGAEVSSY